MNHLFKLKILCLHFFFFLVDDILKYDNKHLKLHSRTSVEALNVKCECCLTNTVIILREDRRRSKNSSYGHDVQHLYIFHSWSFYWAFQIKLRCLPPQCDTSSSSSLPSTLSQVQLSWATVLASVHMLSPIKPTLKASGYAQSNVDQEFECQRYVQSLKLFGTAQNT